MVRSWKHLDGWRVSHGRRANSVELCAMVMAATIRVPMPHPRALDELPTWYSVLAMTQRGEFSC